MNKNKRRPSLINEPVLEWFREALLVINKIEINPMGVFRQRIGDRPSLNHA